ncbi:MAG: hypothetical protein BWY78_01310 [Alphaproteobacteria bacterium ADurb.Bin438]|nr:MAG: hypothetical protein BWY78_01310 [Alphaproteobacteria bacterium ADurb.Bin438]
MSGFDKEFGFSCDFCEENIGGGMFDFNESMEMKKQDGWINRKHDGEWFNFCCEECYQEFLKEERE